MWCVQVPTGAFVARRNGQIFITGNSGFPKSHDISKAIDKKLGAEREVVGSRIKKAGDMRSNSYGKGGNYDDIEINITSPSSDEAKQWDGWGTALKPANEPIVLAIKPISEKTIAENVMKWGTGGINIDGCRIESGGEHKRAYQPTNHERSVYGKQTAFQPSNKEGRFPANVILDEEAGKMLDEQSGILKSGGGNKANKKPPARKSQVIPTKDTGEIWEQNSGGASRFFYCAKASKKERGEGNTHPTVKPLKLISYLITLVTPPNGICLDIFEGSGTHALACIENGFKYIGFELEKKYYDIATERIADKMAQISLFYGN
jgi:site-specific DNA-methyltransferase (adenine-specific)